jgi:hypothetical protein
LTLYFVHPFQHISHPSIPSTKPLEHTETLLDVFLNQRPSYRPWFNMAAAVDTAFLASAYELPEATFTNLINAPSQDLVLTVLQQLIVYANEFSATKAEKLRTDVELEAAVRVGETRVKQLKDTNEKNLKELESIRRQLNESGKLGA